MQKRAPRVAYRFLSRQGRAARNATRLSRHLGIRIELVQRDNLK